MILVKKQLLMVWNCDILFVYSLVSVSGKFFVLKMKFWGTTKRRTGVGHDRVPIQLILKPRVKF